MGEGDKVRKLTKEGENNGRTRRYSTIHKKTTLGEAFMLSAWEQLDSEWIKAARVNREDNFLDLKFKDGAICRYQGASQHFDALISAPSAGKYFHANLKSHPFQKITE